MRASSAVESAQEWELGAPAFDPVSAVISLGGDRELFEEIAHIFLDVAPQLRSQIRETLCRRDAEVFCRAVHSLKRAASASPRPALIAPAEHLEFLGVTEQILGAICERFGRAIMVALDLIVFFPAPI